MLALLKISFQVEVYLSHGSNMSNGDSMNVALRWFVLALDSFNMESPLIESCEADFASIFDNIRVSCGLVDDACCGDDFLSVEKYESNCKFLFLFVSLFV